MSILLVVAPMLANPLPPVANSTMMTLWDRAQAEGEDLLWRPCDDMGDVIRCLSCQGDAAADLILLDIDADAIAAPDIEPLRHALNACKVPVIEVHDDSREGDLARIAPGHASVVSITVPGDRNAGYGMALSVGLRYIAQQRRMAA
ncbi:hypothetical protein FIV34_20005 [Luteibacter pinisoli]|uniref:3-dehydroquinate dehydratase n=1 Tax=Luteibacter pinisoli TaxID=2589080 RepID=A0A4Y5ZAQ2_9GAMM|nr:hypothetical protein [Luteibacter pinisoli]QDE41315.1 hypothetical protein FIV34_20005 [Luteibacter pinisoli]